MTFYYMRDNHTFKRLDSHAPTALAQIEHEFNAGYTHGMLCGGGTGKTVVHANGDQQRMLFFAECKAALEAASGS